MRERERERERGGEAREEGVGGSGDCNQVFDKMEAIHCNEGRGVGVRTFCEKIRGIEYKQISM